MAGNDFSAGFFFRHRSGKLDWEKLEKVDLERVVKEVDVHVLQDNIAHITFADVTIEDLEYFNDGNFLLVFRMTQLIVEYLVNVQNYLLDLGKAKDDNIRALEKELAAAKLQLAEKEEKLVATKKELTFSRKMAKAYKHTGTGGMQAELPSSADVEGGTHWCSHCRVAFISDKYLQAHVQRRHAGISLPKNAAGLGAAEGAGNKKWLDSWGETLKDKLEDRLMATLTTYKEHDRHVMSEKLADMQRQLLAFLHSHRNDPPKRPRVGPVVDDVEEDGEASTLHKLQALEKERASLAAQLQQLQGASSRTQPGANEEAERELAAAKARAQAAIEAESKHRDEDEGPVSTDAADSDSDLAKAVAKGAKGDFSLFPEMPFLRAKFYTPPHEVVRTVETFNTLVLDFDEEDAENLALEVKERNLQAAVLQLEERLEAITRQHYKPSAELLAREEEALNKGQNQTTQEGEEDTEEDHARKEAQAKLRQLLLAEKNEETRRVTQKTNMEAERAQARAREDEEDRARRERVLLGLGAPPKILEVHAKKEEIVNIKLPYVSKGGVVDLNEVPILGGESLPHHKEQAADPSKKLFSKPSSSLFLFGSKSKLSVGDVSKVPLASKSDPSAHSSGEDKRRLQERVAADQEKQRLTPTAAAPTSTGQESASSASSDSEAVDSTGTDSAGSSSDHSTAMRETKGKKTNEEKRRLTATRGSETQSKEKEERQSSKRRERFEKAKLGGALKIEETENDFFEYDFDDVEEMVPAQSSNNVIVDSKGISRPNVTSTPSLMSSSSREPTNTHKPPAKVKTMSISSIGNEDKAADVKNFAAIERESSATPRGDEEVHDLNASKQFGDELDEFDRHRAKQVLSVKADNESLTASGTRGSGKLNPPPLRKQGFMNVDDGDISVTGRNSKGPSSFATLQETTPTVISSLSDANAQGQVSRLKSQALEPDTKAFDKMQLKFKRPAFSGPPRQALIQTHSDEDVGDENLEEEMI